MENDAHRPSDVTAALDSIRRIFRMLRLSSGRSERSLGISAAQLFVLQQLAASPAGSINELAGRTYTHQSSVSVVVRRLVKQGLVARKRAAADGRRRELSLTASGRRLIARAPAPAQVRLIDGLKGLPRRDLAELRRLLVRLVRDMGVADEPASMLFTEGHGSSPNRKPR